MKRPAAGVLLLSLILALPAWASGARRTPQEYAKVDEFVASPLSIYPYTTLDRMRNLDKVLRETSRIVTNTHYPDKKDDVRTFEYDGLVLKVVFVGGSPTHGLLFEIEITDRKWEMKHGLRVGSTAKDVQAVLGEPDERKSDRLRYCGDATCGIFYLNGGLVTRVEFSSPVH